MDLETRDNEGKTALWHAVREEMVGAVEALIKGGAKVYYQNEDLSCPLQLAMKTMLLKRQVIFANFTPVRAKNFQVFM